MYCVNIFEFIDYSLPTLSLFFFLNASAVSYICYG